MTEREREASKVRTTSEEALLRVLNGVWERASEAREVAREEWKRARGIDREPTREHKLCYRGTVDRSGFSLPTLNTTELEHIVGIIAWHWLNGKGVQEGPWGVDLKAPDLDVVVKMLAGWSKGQQTSPQWRTQNTNFPGSFVFLIHIPTLHTARHRPVIPPDLTEGGTSLARFRSYTLATALPVIQTSKGAALTIWEPCVGTGAIAIELDASLAKRRCDYRIFGSDLFAEEIEKCREVVRLCQSSSRLQLAAVDSTNADDAIAFLGGKDVVDGIVTVSRLRLWGGGSEGSMLTTATPLCLPQDLPWGRRVLNHMTIAVLYPALLKVWVQVLKPGGSVVLMTAEQKTFMRAIKAHEADMRKKDTGWVLSVERVQTSGISGDSPDDLLDEGSRPGKMRTVACGCDVSVIFLRKRSLVE